LLPARLRRFSDLAQVEPYRVVDEVGIKPLKNVEITLEIDFGFFLELRELGRDLIGYSDLLVARDLVKGQLVDLGNVELVGRISHWAASSAHGDLSTLNDSQCIRFGEQSVTALRLLPLANQLAVRPIRYVAVSEAAKLWNVSGIRGEYRATCKIYHNFVQHASDFRANGTVCQALSPSPAAAGRRR
jgi:hypothetical protein